MTLEIVSNPDTMVVSVGAFDFDRPILNMRTEIDFGIKETICGPAPTTDVAEMHKFYCDRLGPKFNRRFQAAMYWLWIGNRLSKPVGNMLRLPRKGWRYYNDCLVARAGEVLQHIRQAEADGLLHLVPAIIVFRAAPVDIRKAIGGATWKRIAHNSRTRNERLMRTAWIHDEDPHYPDRFLRLLDFPSGVLNAVSGFEPECEAIAARITPRKTPLVFQQTVHIVRDTRRLLGREFNPAWSLARMQREHDAAAREVRRGRFSDKPFAEPFTYEADGFTGALLTSQLDVAIEGDTQHHCVGSYAGLAGRGEYAVIRIEGKERATAGYQYTKTGWQLDQVYGACNAIVKAECQAFASAAGAALSSRDGLARRAA